MPGRQHRRESAAGTHIGSIYDMTTRQSRRNSTEHFPETTGPNRVGPALRWRSAGSSTFCSWILCFREASRTPNSSENDLLPSFPGLCRDRRGLGAQRRPSRTPHLFRGRRRAILQRSVPNLATYALLEAAVPIGRFRGELIT
jgi:hypothetical protein